MTSKQTNLHADGAPASPSAKCRRRGRILRLKQGYNPNSSSIGSIVFALPVLLVGATALFGAAAGLIASAFLRRSPGTSRNTQTPAADAAEGADDPHRERQP